VIDAKAFEKDGGLTIGIGAQEKLFTLRSEWWDTRSEFDGVKHHSVPIRRSSHIRNLGKDWAEVAERLPSILQEAGVPGSALYVPGSAEGTLSPNMPPSAKYMPTNEVPFGKYQGQDIEAVFAKDPDYVFYLAENYQPNDELPRGRWMAFLRDKYAEPLAVRAEAKKAERDAKEAVRAADRVRLAPLAAIIRGASRQDGDFCDSIAKDLESGAALEEMSPRAASIIEEIYAKRSGRRGSKKYNSAVEEFNRAFLRPDPADVAPGAPGLRPLPEPRMPAPSVEPRA
jgi:hypothetical protein